MYWRSSRSGSMTLLSWLTSICERDRPSKIFHQEQQVKRIGRTLLEVGKPHVEAALQRPLRNGSGGLSLQSPVTRRQLCAVRLLRGRGPSRPLVLRYQHPTASVLRQGSGTGWPPSSFAQARFRGELHQWRARSTRPRHRLRFGRPLVPG